jgi:hypothetical protein
LDNHTSTKKQHLELKQQQLDYKAEFRVGQESKKKKEQRNISVPFLTKFYLLKCKENKIKRMVPGKGHLRLVLFQEL